MSWENTAESEGDGYDSDVNPEFNVEYEPPPSESADDDNFLVTMIFKHCRLRQRHPMMHKT